MSQGVFEQPRLEPLATEVKVAESSILTDDFIRQLINVGEVDVLVGLPTHNNASTIGPVVSAIQVGLLRAFPRERAAIINVDGGSRDGTPDLVTGASIDDIRHASNLYALRTLHSISTQYSTAPSSGIALRTILSAAELLRAKACAVISPESTNIEPDWIARLLQPIYHDNCDLVTPVYRRQKFEGLLVRNLIYPMTRAIYGWRLREPYPSEFGFSGGLGSQFLAQNAWSHEVGQTGVEINLAITAMAGDYRLQQSFLGMKVHADRSSTDLVPALRQTVGTLFWSLENHFSAWSVRSASQPVPTQGAESEVTLEPVRVNRKRLYEMFRSSISDLDPVFRSILSPATLAELQRIATLDETQFQYPTELWVKTVYEFAASYHRSVISRDHIIQALAPLYRGRIFTFLVENRTGSAADIENNVELLCLEFERLKPYLLELWNGRE
jgi:glucosylglycerate synthase